MATATTKADFEKALKPLIKKIVRDSIKEILFEEGGIVSRIVQETVSGLSKTVLVEGGRSTRRSGGDEYTNTLKPGRSPSYNDDEENDNGARFVSRDPLEKFHQNLRELRGDMRETAYDKKAVLEKISSPHLRKMAEMSEPINDRENIYSQRSNIPSAPVENPRNIESPTFSGGGSGKSIQLKNGKGSINENSVPALADFGDDAGVPENVLARFLSM